MNYDKKKSTQDAFYLIGLKSKKWLCGEMELHFSTLERKLKSSDWKKSEMVMLNHLKTIS